MIAFSVEDPHLALVAIRALPEPDACVDPALRVGGDVGHLAAPGELSPVLNELVLIVSDSETLFHDAFWYFTGQPFSTESGVVYVKTTSKVSLPSQDGAHAQQFKGDDPSPRLWIPPFITSRSRQECVTMGGAPLDARCLDAVRSHSGR